MSLKPPIDPTDSLGSFTVGLYAHVSEFGAVGNGTTNDSTRIQAAIDAVAAAGGGALGFSAKTYRCNITAKPNVHLVGEAVGATVLKAVAGSNTDVIKGLNFATLTGKTKATGDYALGCPNFQISNMTIDGDKSTQSAGYGIRIWGRAPRFSGKVEIRSCKSGGMWTEFTEVDSFADANQILEGQIDTIEIHGCDGNGWTHRGPHDFVVKVATIWSCTGHPVRVETDWAGGGASGNSWNGGVLFLMLNEYLNGNSVYGDGTQLEIHAGQVTTATSGTALEFTSNSSSGKIGPGVIIAGASAGTNKGVILAGSGHYINAQVLRNNIGIELNGAINCRIDVFGSGNNTVVNNISEAGPNYITGLFDVPGGGTLRGGSAFNVFGMYWLKAYNGISTTIQQLPSATLNVGPGAWNPILPNANTTLVPGGTTIATYGATVSIDASAAVYQRITVTNGTAFTIAAPTNGKTWPLIIEIFNNSGGAMGTITWNGAYQLAGAFTNPANTKRRTIMFYELGGVWYEISRAAADI